MTVRCLPVTGGNATELHAAGAGGKAEGLARLSALGVAVPPAVVLVGAVDGTPIDVAPVIAGVGTGPVAVRSSAVGEDGTDASYAGQYDVLNVQGTEALTEAIQRCLASLDSERASAYRAEQHHPSERTMSVVVQAMIQPAFAGVLFTADPTTGRRDRMVLDYVAGLGEALVSGTADPVHLVTTMEGERCGAPPDASLPQMPEEHVRKILREGQDIAQQLGASQDLEWAVDAEGVVWWLQTRPITTLPEPLNALDTTGIDPTHVYTRCNIGEMMPGAVTPSPCRDDERD